MNRQGFNIRCSLLRKKNYTKVVETPKTPKLPSKLLLKKNSLTIPGAASPVLTKRFLTPDLLNPVDSPNCNNNSPSSSNIVQMLRKNRSLKTIIGIQQFELVGKKMPHFLILTRTGPNSQNEKPKKTEKIKISQAETSSIKPEISKKSIKRKTYTEKVYLQTKVRTREGPSINRGIQDPGDSISINGWDGEE